MCWPHLAADRRLSESLRTPLRTASVVVGSLHLLVRILIYDRMDRVIPTLWQAPVPLHHRRSWRYAGTRSVAGPCPMG